jgi:hypothetical protein
MASDNRSTDYSREKMSRSHLFMLRVWQEATGPAETEWRGRLQHVPSGQVCYFRDWAGLVSDMLSILSDDSGVGATPHDVAAQDSGKRPDELESDMPSGDPRQVPGD